MGNREGHSQSCPRGRSCRGANQSPINVSAAPQPNSLALKPTPEELLLQLAALKVAPGASQARVVRQVLSLLEQLAHSGQEALPAIRQFVGSNRDVEYDSVSGKGPRDIRALTDAVLPPSLRLALFDVVRQIGGNNGEQLLAETLGLTKRGLEVAFLTQLLEEMASGKYRNVALAAAQALLNRGAAESADRFQRDYLFNVLRRFNDA